MKLTEINDIIAENPNAVFRLSGRAVGFLVTGVEEEPTHSGRRKVAKVCCVPLNNDGSRRVFSQAVMPSQVQDKEYDSPEEYAKACEEAHAQNLAYREENRRNSEFYQSHAEEVREALAERLGISGAKIRLQPYAVTLTVKFTELAESLGVS